MTFPAPVWFKDTQRLPAQFWGNLALFLLPAMATTVPSGSSYSAALLVLVGSVAFFKASPQERKLPADARWLFLSFLPLAACWLLDDLSSGLSVGRSAEKPIRMLLTLPALCYLAHRPPAHIWLWLGASVGSMIACTEAVYQFFFLQMARAQGAMFSIHFGDLVLMLGLMSLCAWHVPVRQNRWVFRAWLLMGCMAGMLASILSGTRGAWLGLGVILAIYGAYLLFGRHFKRLALLAAASACLLGVALSVPSLKVEDRVQAAYSDMQAFAANSAANTSVGARLQMWQHAWQLYRARPLLGWQRHGYLEQQRIGIARQELDPLMAQLDHPHNEWLNLAAKDGTVGLLALLLAYAVPFGVFLRLFRQARQPYHASLRAVAAAGMLLPVAYFGFGLTEAFLPHSSVITVYCYLLCLLWGAAHGLQKRALLARDPASSNAPPPDLNHARSAYQ
ncbi:MAG: O-antigen ligase family protein [Brachymonas sp.]|nr:O-antigen ligase family protein [Brachymonas sp.]